MNYNNHIIKLITDAEKMFGKVCDYQGKKVMDFGAGIATLFEVYARKTGIKPLAVEMGPDQKKIIHTKGYQVVTTIEEVQNEEFDTIYSSNVLEHIEDDVATLVSLKNKLKQEGLLILYLPAFQCLWAELDERVGHFRRYHMKEIKMKLLDAGFKVKYAHYVDSLAFLIVMLFKLMGKREGKMSKKSLKIYDKLFLFSCLLDQLGFKRFCGKKYFYCCCKIYVWVPVIASVSS